MNAGVPLTVLDLGNVLVSVHFERFVEHAAAVSGRDAGDVAGRWVTGPAKLRYERGDLTSRGFFDAMTRDLGLTADRRRDLVAAWCDIFTAEPGAAAAVSALARRGPVWLLSDTNPLHERWCRHRWPWLDLCTRRLVSWRRGLLKAEPGGFGGLIAAAGRPPGEIRFVDDQPANVAAARRAGLQAHRFTGWPAARRWLGLPPAGKAGPETTGPEPAGR
jgi:putative hydrolase of the HAD superfamily